MKQRWWFSLLLLALLSASPAHGENIARIDPLQSPSLEQQAGQRAGIFLERRFDEGGADGVRTIGNGEWLIQPVRGVKEPLLVIHHPYTARVSVADAPGGAPRAQDIFQRGLDPQYSRRALVFPLSGDGPVHVKVEHARYPLHVAVQPRAAYAAGDLRHLRLLWPASGVVLGVSLAVLLFWAVLRDRVYLLYALAMLSQLVYALCSYGEAYALPGLRMLGAWEERGIWLFGILGTLLLVCLWLDYAGLRHATPRLARLLKGVGVYAYGVALLGLLLPWPADKRLLLTVANGLFLAINAIGLLALTLAWRRGQRHAAYLLVAWLPLLVFSVLRALNFSNGQRAEAWLEYGTPWVLAFTAVVLALGLADRMLTIRRERDHAKEHAERDGLTGVLNRGGIEYRLDWALIEMHREHIPVSLLFIDLDHFKKINDRHGHALGDACLRAVARVVSEEFQYGDQLGRLGGEEFVLVLAGADLPAALQIAERVRTRIHQDCAVVDGIVVNVTASIGAAQGQPDDDVAALIARADQAMYVAKRAGGNQVRDGRALEAARKTEALEDASVE